MSDELQGEIQFLTELAVLTEEFVEAREVRKQDPERWDVAKHEFQAYRTHWKQIREYVNATSQEGTVTPDPAEPTIEIHGEGV